MIFNMVCSNGSLIKSTIIVSIDAGSTVGVYSDAACTTLVKNATEKNEGEFWITGLNNGVYYIKATKNSDESIISYTIAEYGVYRISMTYRTVPEFTYTGSYQVVQDDDTVVNPSTYKGKDWKIRFLTSGTLNFNRLMTAENGIDVFLVGGGGAGSNGLSATYEGSGGGGGYTRTTTNVSVATGVGYSIVVGAGGTGTASGNGNNGGASSAFGSTANGGNGGTCSSSKCDGGNGGSGGGGGNNQGKSGSGAVDGGTGLSGTSQIGGTVKGGSGQGTTTREFGGYSNTVLSNVSSSTTFTLVREPSAIEKKFLVNGKYITIVGSSSRETRLISSYNTSTRTVTIATAVSASAGSTVQFGNMYSSGGCGYNQSTTLPGAVPALTAGSNNTGNAGGGSYGATTSYKGGSGIVIIRNARS